MSPPAASSSDRTHVADRDHPDTMRRFAARTAPAGPRACTERIEAARRDSDSRTSSASSGSASRIAWRRERPARRTCRSRRGPDPPRRDRDGRPHRLAERFRDLPADDHGDAIVLPGFIDAHIHFPRYRMLAVPGKDWPARAPKPVRARNPPLRARVRAARRGRRHRRALPDLELLPRLGALRRRPRGPPGPALSHVAARRAGLHRSEVDRDGIVRQQRRWCAHETTRSRHCAQSAHIRESVHGQSGVNQRRPRRQFRGLTYGKAFSAGTPERRPATAPAAPGPPAATGRA